MTTKINLNDIDPYRNKFSSETINELDFFINDSPIEFKHGSKGEYRRFFGTWREDGTYSSDRFGNDVYCNKCNHWSTVKDTNILFSIAGNCKNCGETFLK